MVHYVVCSTQIVLVYKKWACKLPCLFFYLFQVIYIYIYFILQTRGSHVYATWVCRESVFSHLFRVHSDEDSFTGAGVHNFHYCKGNCRMGMVRLVWAFVQMVWGLKLTCAFVLHICLEPFADSIPTRRQNSDLRVLINLRLL